MAEKNAYVRKALAIMAKNKKNRDAGVPAGQDADKEYIGKDASNNAGQSPRALMEEKNNELARQLAKKKAGY